MKYMTHASANVASASASVPIRRTGKAMSAPSTPATAAPSRQATRKFICPWCSTSGMSKLHFDQGGGRCASEVCSAQPAMKPPAVTNVAWARLTMPPMPVTTTNERNTIASARPGARMFARTYVGLCGHEKAPSV